MKTNVKNKAFTLIELLVVISIIAILMAVMIPALRRARETAQYTICRSNMRGLGLAALLWAEDNDGWALPGLWDRGNQGDPLIKPYLGDTQSGDGVGLCPTVSARYAGKTYGELGLENDVAGLANAGNYYSSYGINQTLCNRTSRPLGIYDMANENGSQWGRNNVWYSRHGNVRLASVYKPSGKVMFGESILYLSSPWFYNKSMLNPAFRDPAARGFRHFARRSPVTGTSETEMVGRMNITWIDGSVTEQPEDIRVLRSSGRGYEVNSKYWQGDNTIQY